MNLICFIVNIPARANGFFLLKLIFLYVIGIHKYFPGLQKYPVPSKLKFTSGINDYQVIKEAEKYYP